MPLNVSAQSPPVRPPAADRVSAIQALSGIVPVDSELGIADAFLQSEMAWNAGARWQRVLFSWDAVQPDWNGQSLPNRFISDAVIKNELDRGFRLVGIIGNPPRWATGEGSVPRNLGLPLDDPNNNWARFVRQIATTYAGRIDTWIIWNEPDIKPGQPGSTWNGTDAEYWLLLKTASKAIKAANPKAVVAIAGTTYWADARYGRKLFLERVLEVAAADHEATANDYFFDAVPYHIYSSPYKVYEVARIYQDILSRFKLKKPLWLSETNIVPHDDPHAQVARAAARGTLEEQANFAVQTLALARAAGVERVQFYKMMDGPIEGGEPYGIVRNDRTIRPIYVAIQNAMKNIPAQIVPTYTKKDGIARVVFDAGRKRTTVTWATDPVATPSRLPPLGTTAKLIDKYGRESALGLPSKSPFYEFTLAPATANTAGNALDYIVGGDPVIVTEDGIGDSVEMSPNSLFFPITGMNVTGSRLDFFRKRGGLNTFGYPISRPFRLLGKDVQIFQRQVLERRADGSIATINVLDDDYLPLTRFNGAEIPPRDSELTRTAPLPTAKDYSVEILKWVLEIARDDWEGQPVRFRAKFSETVTPPVAFPDGRGNLDLLPGLNLELWGVPTSHPKRDPSNANFVYQRFQRGVMHFDRGTKVTQGLLLAAYLKAIMTGDDIPADVDVQARDSRFYKQYDRTKPNWLARPTVLPDSDLSMAFEREIPVR